MAFKSPAAAKKGPALKPVDPKLFKAAALAIDIKSPKGLWSLARVITQLMHERFPDTVPKAEEDLDEPMGAALTAARELAEIGGKSGGLVRALRAAMVKGDLETARRAAADLNALQSSMPPLGAFNALGASLAHRADRNRHNQAVTTLMVLDQLVMIKRRWGDRFRLVEDAAMPFIALRVDTDEIVLTNKGQKYNIGSLKMILKLSLMMPRVLNSCFGVHPTNKSIYAKGDTKGYYHPHVSAGGSLCMGEAGGPIVMALSQARLFDFFDVCQTVLSQYHEVSMYQDLAWWGVIPTACPVCGDTIPKDKSEACASSRARCCPGCLTALSDGRKVQAQFVVDFEGQKVLKADIKTVKVLGQKIKCLAKDLVIYGGGLLQSRQAPTAMVGRCCKSGVAGLVIGKAEDELVSNHPFDIVVLPDGRRVGVAFVKEALDEIRSQQPAVAGKPKKEKTGDQSIQPIAAPRIKLDWAGSGASPAARFAKSLGQGGGGDDRAGDGLESEPEPAPPPVVDLTPSAVDLFYHTIVDTSTG